MITSTTITWHIVNTRKKSPDYPQVGKTIIFIDSLNGIRSGTVQQDDGGLYIAVDLCDTAVQAIPHYKLFIDNNFSWAYPDEVMHTETLKI